MNTNTGTINWAGNIIQHVDTGGSHDLVYGNALNNYFYTASGNDTIDAGGGNDTIEGRSGDDLYIFTGTWGADSIIDSGNTDTVDFSAITSAIVANLNSGTGNEVSDGTNTVNWASSVIENIITGSGNDGIDGNSSANSIQSGAGADTMDGFAGNDTLNGGDGNDVYVFSITGWGNDTIIDSSGTSDRVVFWNS